MNTSAIQQAIKLYKHPQEMQWLCSADAQLPEGVTDLLRLCASEKKLNDFVEKIHIKESVFTQVLNDFVDKVLFNPDNSDKKQLGLSASDDSKKQKLHYKLLMKIFHPDRNPSEDAQSKASHVSQIYNRLKSSDSDESIYVGENIEVSYKRTSQSTINTQTDSHGFKKAAEKVQHQVSYARNAFVATASMAVLAMIVLGLNLFEPDKPELVISKIPATQNHNTEQSGIVISLVALSNANASKIPNSQLEKILHKLESAYERGDVAQIKPILENTPDIKNQSDAEISAKLETLFKITNDRKMLLFNFDWKNTPKVFHGEGMFLSRYMMMGEDQWSTREGKAYITAEINNKNQLEVTHFQLKDNTIEQ